MARKWFLLARVQSTLAFQNESVLRMAHDFDRTVVAEGVENQEALELLRELGCDVICPHLSGPSTIIVWTLREKMDGQEASHAGGDYREVA